MAKIVIIDNDEESLTTLYELLEKQGHAIFCFENGNEVLDKFPSLNPDLVIMEYNLPGVSGEDICRELRSRESSFNVPIMFVSSASKEEEILAGLAAGADEYLLKPLRESEAASKISVLLTKRHRTDDGDMANNVTFTSQYKILNTLGKGGYGTVYLAEDKNGKKVALKVMEGKTLGKKFISQFLREAYSLSLLNHNNIVKLVQFGTYGNKYFLVTEYVEGNPLNSIIKNSPVSENYAIRIARALCEAFEHMNERGIVHRDIKPGNILIGPDESITIIDFGLAKDRQQHTVSLDGQMQGTPYFIAPEYINNEPLSIKVDIYSLGITLFYAVTGQLPFEGDNSDVIIDAHLNKTPPRAMDVFPMISESFSCIIDHMLIKDPAKRISLRKLTELLEKCERKEVLDFTDDDEEEEEDEASKEELMKAKCLAYHSHPIPGKISLLSTKSCASQEELSMAYSPGVAYPCLDINENPDDVWRYTAKGNLVAVVSDGTAVLGLGNIGPEAGMPVMEGKGVLFKRFADVDAFPICLKDVFDESGRSDAKLLIETTNRLEPTFGGINLEDIAAPACFEVEETLKEKMNIPVFHDDQHGTAIISLAGLINALKMVDKKIEDCRFVVNGAGASGIACSEFYISAGATRENFLLCDSKGVIHEGRIDSLTPAKAKFAAKTERRTLEEALKGADVFIGLSIGNVVSEEMISSMADNPIVFAMANPTPEIYPDKALKAGAAVVGTGRSDFPNQVNNVLGFPGIFRGALDVKATDINEPMKLAASRALSEIVNEKTPDHIYKVLVNAYPEDAKNGMFEGAVPLKATYVIPKPFDSRVVPRVAKYVAEAAMNSGVARTLIEDLDLYEQQVSARIAKNI